MYIKGTGEDQVIITVYVNDLTVAGKKLVRVAEEKADLMRRYTMTDGWELTHILGILVERDRSKREIFIHQQKYTEEILTKFQPTKSNSRPHNASQNLPEPRHVPQDKRRKERDGRQALQRTRGEFAVPHDLHPA